MLHLCNDCIHNKVCSFINDAIDMHEEKNTIAVEHPTLDMVIVCHERTTIDTIKTSMAIDNAYTDSVSTSKKESEVKYFHDI